MKKVIFLFTLSIIGFAACDEPDCIYTASDVIKVGFYSYPKDSSIKVRINKLQLKGNDQLIVETSTLLTSVTLPLNPMDTAITAFFDSEYGLDTLIISYQISSRLIAEECGIETSFSGFKAVRSDFDSVRVVRSITQINIKQPEVINENIRVYN